MSKHEWTMIRTYSDPMEQAAYNIAWAAGYWDGYSDRSAVTPVEHKSLDTFTLGTLCVLVVAAFMVGFTVGLWV